MFPRGCLKINNREFKKHLKFRVIHHRTSRFSTNLGGGDLVISASPPYNQQLVQPNSSTPVAIEAVFPRQRAYEIRNIIIPDYVVLYSRF
jgi:hypothetical protein